MEKNQHYKSCCLFRIGLISKLKTISCEKILYFREKMLYFSPHAVRLVRIYLNQMYFEVYALISPAV